MVKLTARRRPAFRSNATLPSTSFCKSGKRSCTVSGCSAAASADSTWASLGYPTSRGWYDWPDGECSYAGGEYYDYDGQLPSGDTFYEYDVFPRACGNHRDAYRIVVDFTTGAVWYSPDHYSDLSQL